MTRYFKKICDFFDWLAENWSENSVIQTTRSAGRIIWQSFLAVLAIVMIGLFFSIGTIAGYFANLVRDQPIISGVKLQKEINNYSESSESYFAGNIPIGKMSHDLIREKAELKAISPNLIHAVIAIEDESFYEHKGVVPKAVLRASTEELLNKPQVTGGSTITQQLIKNQLLTSEVSFDRKAKEILLAMRTERFFSKNQILEAYLNVATFGRDASGNNIAGAAAAAEGIFGVEASKLNIPQAAFIAGLPKNPFVYSPFQNNGGAKKDFSAGIGRAHTVLHRMYASGYISKKQMNESLKYDYRQHLVKSKKRTDEDYPELRQEVEHRTQIVLAKLAANRAGYNGDRLYQDYLSYKNMEYEYSQGIYDRSLKEIAKLHGYHFDAMSRNKKIFDELLTDAEKQIATGGYKVYTTINKPIYDGMQNVAKGYSGYSSDKYARDRKGQIIEVTNKETGKKEKLEDPMQVGSVLIENKTGKILSFVGGRDFQRSEFNYATNVPRQNGSTMKPLLVYAPAMELGLVQPGSIVADLPYKRGKYMPHNYGGRYHGFETARVALAQSHNVPAVSVFTRLSSATDRAPQYLKKMGITSLVGSDGYSPANALGGVTKGITVEENTNAYTTFANNGQFVDAFMIDKIVDRDGKVIYRHQKKPVRVFSSETSYLMLDMMRDVFKYGTGAATPGLLEFSADWAGKTGTSQDWRDSWLVGTNPNVTLGVWNGYAHNQTLDRSRYSQQTRTLWAGFANSAYHVDPNLMAPEERFQPPEGVVRQTFCGLTGGRVTGMCQAAGFAKTDVMNTKYLPQQTIEALEPVQSAPKPDKPDQPSSPKDSRNTSEKAAPEDGFRIKPDFLMSHFPYLDLQSADPSLLGKIRK
ncbi:penicillin-binding protein [Sporolactobacillus sp. THM7-7]|nr:penicillin-binding protein [Sporolactobacillus sp. THM7-7]